MEKLLVFAFIVSPGVLFAFLRVPETPTLTPTLAPTLAPTLTLEAQPSCQVAAVYSPSRKTGSDTASGEVGRFVSLLGDALRKLNW